MFSPDFERPKASARLKATRCNQCNKNVDANKSEEGLKKALLYAEMRKNQSEWTPRFDQLV